MTDERLFDLLTDTVADVLAARTLDEVIHALLSNVGKELDVWGVWITAILPGPNTRIMALSAIGETMFSPGETFPTLMTPEMAEYHRRSVAGQVVLHRVEEGILGLVDHVLSKKGVRAMAVLPLLVGGELRGNLVISSGVGEGVRQVHVPFFDGVARGVEEHVVGLIEASGLAGA